MTKMLIIGSVAYLDLTMLYRCYNQGNYCAITACINVMLQRGFIKLSGFEFPRNEIFEFLDLFYFVVFQQK